MASVVVNGDVSGSVTLQAPSAAGSVTVTLPAASGTMASLASVTANGVAYVNSSSQPTSGSALAFNGSKLGIGVTSFDVPLQVQAITGGLAMRFNGRASPADGYSDIGFYNSANTTQYAGIGAANSGLFLATNIATPITFTTNNAEAGRFDSSGNLLVGTTSGTQSRFVKSISGDFVLSVQNSLSTNPYVLELMVPTASANDTTYAYVICRNANGTNRAIIFGNGNVVNVNNSYGAISDAKLKENIVDASPKLDDLMQVKVRNYNLIGETTKQLGVVAQELETVFPAMVDESPDKDAEGKALSTTTKSVKYSVFVPMLIKAIQEQQALITQLQADVAALKGA